MILETMFKKRKQIGDSARESNNFPVRIFTIGQPDADDDALNMSETCTDLGSDAK